MRLTTVALLFGIMTSPASAQDDSGNLHSLFNKCIGESGSFDTQCILENGTQIMRDLEEFGGIRTGVMEGDCYEISNPTAMISNAFREIMPQGNIPLQNETSWICPDNNGEGWVVSPFPSRSI